MTDWVVVEVDELERIRASARAWKRCAKRWRLSSQWQRLFKEEWYAGYRRAWRLDEPTIEQRAVSLWAWIAALFTSPAKEKP